MKNANKPAYPTDLNLEGVPKDSGTYHRILKDSMGLTKRERFAMAAMQGLLPELKNDQSPIPHQSLIAEYAVHYADALLKQLEETA